jgi:hypothetical protein
VKLFLLSVAVYLSGCTMYSSHATKLYFLCYKDEGLLLPNGMYADNELNYKCNGRRFFQYQHQFGEESLPILMDFSKYKDGTETIR